MFRVGPDVYGNRRRLTSISQAFLREFHARYPGITAATLAHNKTAAGVSSYEALARDVAALPWPPRTILDLACGDGYLLHVLAQRFPGARLFGVDMSPEELAAARIRLGSRSELQLAQAHALPLEDAACDAVTCHLAFMLMEDAPAVVREIARVLVPGGIFAAVINGGRLPDPVRGAFGTALREVEAAEELPPLLIGDPRIQNEDLLHDLLREHFSHVEVFEETIALDGTRDQVGAALLGFYNLHRLTPEGHAVVRERLEEAMRSNERADGVVPCTLPIRRIRAHKR